MSKKSAPPKPYENLWQRIMANVRYEAAPGWADVHGPCMIWTRRLNARGYAFMGIWDSARGWSRSWLVHRVVIHLWHGLPWHEIPVGAHLCGNKPCVSPFHLAAQTEDENRQYYLEVERPAKLRMGREPGED
jgi:hypothetical protein